MKKLFQSALIASTKTLCCLSNLGNIQSGFWSLKIELVDTLKSMTYKRKPFPVSFFECKITQSYIIMENS